MARGEKTRNHGTMTEAEFWGMFDHVLRRLTLHRWKPGKEYAKSLRKLRTEIPKEQQGKEFTIITKRGTKIYRVTGRERYLYPCESCKYWFSEKAIDKDHKHGCGESGSFENLAIRMSRMFIEIDGGWQCLCKPCHKKRSAEQRKRG